jgi:hypothetical protein
MNKLKASKVLEEAIQDDGCLFEEIGDHIAWPSAYNLVRLDGEFDVETLEAIVWWVKNNHKRVAKASTDSGEERTNA